MANVSIVADEVARRLEKLGYEIFDSDDVLEALQNVVFVESIPRKHDGVVAVGDQSLINPQVHESDKGIYFIQTPLTHAVQNVDNDLIEEEEESEDADDKTEREVT